MPSDVITRTVSATDGAQVNGSSFRLENQPGPVTVGVVVTTTGTPTTYDARTAIEGSVDGGTTWFQLIRMADVTNAAPNARYARLGGLGAASESAPGVSALAGAAASATISFDAPWPSVVRVVTKLQTLTGGSTPTVTWTVVVEG